MGKEKHLRIRMSLGDLLTQAVCRLICLFFVALFLIPIGYVVLSSLRSSTGWSLDGYLLLGRSELVLSGLRNSILVTALGTAYSLALEIPTAYVLSRKEYGWLTNLFFHLGQFGVAILPLYLLLKQLGLINSMWALILPCGFSFHYTQHLRARMLSASRELEDAAALDGCGTLGYLLRICIPSMGPTVAVYGFFQASGYWSNFMLARTFLTEESKFPLTLVLNQLLIRNQTANVFGVGQSAASLDATQMAQYALCVLSALPMVALFLTIKRHVRTLETEGGLVL